MKSFKYIIKDELGIHARPAGMLTKEAKKFHSVITLEANGKSVDVSKIIAIMGMGVKKGTEITLTAEGIDEEKAIERLEEFFKENL